MPPLLCDWCKPAPLHHRAQPGSVGALLRCDARISVGRLGDKQVERRAHIDLTAAHAVDQGQVNRRATGMARPVRDIAEPDQIPLGIMPARMPGRIKGRVTMRKTSGGLAPSVPVASSSRLDRPSSPSSGLPCRNSAARRQPAAHHSIRHCPTGQIPTFTPHRLWRMAQPVPIRVHLGPELAERLCRSKADSAALIACSCT
jgi:hypothetical protein